MLKRIILGKKYIFNFFLIQYLLTSFEVTTTTDPSEIPRKIKKNLAKFHPLSIQKNPQKFKTPKKSSHPLKYPKTSKNIKIYRSKN